MSDDRLAESDDRNGGQSAVWEVIADEAPISRTDALRDGAPSSPPCTPVAIAAVAMATPGERRHAGRLRGWWAGAPANLRGSVLMLTAILFFSMMVGLFKLIGGRVPLIQILIVRQIVICLCVAAVMGTAFPIVLRTRRPGLQVMRGLLMLAGMSCGFFALTRIPLAQATAISFSQILFVTIAAVLVLGEKVDRARWIATIIGFAGVLIMLNPFAGELNAYGLLSVGGALFGAGITVSVRKLAATERTETILIYQGLVLFAVLGIPGFMVWESLSTADWLVLLLFSLSGAIGQWLITRAYQLGEAAALAPLDFSRLLFACLIGYVVFAEVPALSTFLGAAIVIAATLYTIRRNAAARTAHAVAAAS